MSVSYDIFTDAFLSKVSEYDFLTLDETARQEIIDGYLKRAVNKFRKNCKYDLVSASDSENRIFDVDIPSEDIDEIVDIVSEGMIVQWLKPFVNRQELLENCLNTRDFTTYSPAELLMRVGNAYTNANKEFIQAIREYSYNHSDLGELHI